jgi:hypothetical protein
MAKWGGRPSAPGWSSGVLANTVRYVRRDNSVLRLVLYNLWNSRGYWCHRPRDFSDAEIEILHEE